MEHVYELSEQPKSNTNVYTRSGIFIYLITLNVMSLATMFSAEEVKVALEPVFAWSSHSIIVFPETPPSRNMHDLFSGIVIFSLHTHTYVKNCIFHSHPTS